MKRRRVIQLIGGAVALSGVGVCGAQLLPPSPSAHRRSAREIAKELFESLDDDARRFAVVPYDHPLRQFHNAGVPAGGAFVMSLPRTQRRMVTDLLYAGLSDVGQERVPNEYYTRLPGVHAMKVLFCGDPRVDEHQIIITGPHLNLRVGGKNREGVAFGGPQVFGDQRGNEEPGLPGNLYRDQLELGQTLYRDLTDAEKRLALLPKAPPETQIDVRGEAEKPGVSIASLSKGSRATARALIDAILSTWPADDVAYARRCIEENGGIEAMSFASYADGAVGGSLQIFRLEGPTAVFHWRGAPHLHAYVNVGMTKTPLSVGELLGENPRRIEGDDVKALFERVMLAHTGAEYAYFDRESIAGALREGPIRTGDIYTLEIWGEPIVVADVKGAKLAKEFAAQVGTVDPKKTYRVATSWLERVGDADETSRGPLLRDATIAYLKRHGFS